MLFRSGLKPWRPDVDAVVGKVMNDSPAALAGLESQDKIIGIDGVVINNWFDLVKFVSVRPEQKLKMLVMRDNQQKILYITPKLIERDSKKIGQIGIGPANESIIPDSMKAEYQYPIVTGFIQASEKVWRNSVLTLNMMGKLVTGQVSLKNLSGPINIAVYAGYSASAGDRKSVV